MKWMKPYEVNQNGVYLMHRTDDYPFGVYGANTVLVKDVVDHVGNTRFVVAGRHDDDDVPYIDTYDAECRFFGPIPDCE